MKSRTERLHNLNTVLADFTAIQTLLHGGYRFDDDQAASVFQQLKLALGLLAQEIKSLEKEWKDFETHAEE